jgi:maltose operon protein
MNIKTTRVAIGKVCRMAANIIKMRQGLYEIFAMCKPVAKSTISPLFCLGLLSCFLLASCAMPLGTARERYEATPVVSYHGFVNFPYEKLSLKDSKAFRIDEHSPAFDFGTGKSFFRAFALPQSPTPYTVTVRSYLVGHHLNSGYIFAPRVIFLNDRFTVTRTLETGDFHYAKPGLFETSGWRAMLEGSTRIDRSARDERYLIILTTKEALKEKTILPFPVIIPVIMPGVVTAIPTGKQMDIPVSNSPVGNLRIILE